jgi:hypothetical protein
VSGAEPGPDWWRASDGRWYPPELYPARPARPRPVPEAATDDTGTAAGPTDPAAAPGRPPEAPAGTEEIAGSEKISAEEYRRRRVTVVAAVVLVVLFVAFVVATVSDRHRSAPPPADSGLTVISVPMGQVVALGDASRTGIANARVLSISTHAATPRDRQSIPGQQLVAVDIEFCAGPQGAVGPDVSQFYLVLPTGLASPLPGVTTYTPSLEQYDTAAPNQCLRGFLTYEAPSTASPDAVRYTADPGHLVVWRS